MPLYYDVTRLTSTNASGNTESSHLWVKTAANQETARITGIFPNIQNSSTVGSGNVRVKDNSSTTASGGTAQTPRPRNIRLAAASAIWANDASAITPGATLTIRQVVGFAQTGGNNGWVAVEPAAAIQMMANATNPVDVEFTSLTLTGSQSLQLSVEFCEGT